MHYVAPVVASDSMLTEESLAYIACEGSCRARLIRVMA